MWVQTHTPMLFITPYPVLWHQQPLQCARDLEQKIIPVAEPGNWTRCMSLAMQDNLPPLRVQGSLWYGTLVQPALSCFFCQWVVKLFDVWWAKLSCHLMFPNHIVSSFHLCNIYSFDSWCIEPTASSHGVSAHSDPLSCCQQPFLSSRRSSSRLQVSCTLIALLQLVQNVYQWHSLHVNVINKLVYSYGSSIHCSKSQSGTSALSLPTKSTSCT